jgi:membrane protein YdbS with pleckstrin-like domain
VGKIDRAKEFIGYLKVVFGILIAVDVSIIAWLFQNTNYVSNLKILIVSIVAVCLIFSIIVINKKILNKIDELEDL